MIETTCGREVIFEEERHIYWVDGVKVRSVSGFKKKFEPEFNVEYWSDFKAKKNGWYDDEGNPDVKRVLDLWDYKRKASLERGTKIHKTIEDYFLKKGYKQEDKQLLLDVTRLIPACKAIKNDDTIKFYPEQILYSDKFNLCGTADLLVVKGNTCLIYDYKTNEAIDKVAFKNERLYNELAFITNCNYDKYKLQLSLYACMMQHNGFDVKAMAIIHIDHDMNVHLLKLDLNWINILDKLNIYKDDDNRQ